jgi:hypothetical protein
MSHSQQTGGSDFSFSPRRSLGEGGSASCRAEVGRRQVKISALPSTARDFNSETNENEKPESTGDRRDHGE